MKVYVGAIFLLSVLAGAQCQCPSNWLQRKDVCFLISEVKANFDDARSRCREMGGDLAKIEDVVKNGLIRALHSGFSNMLVGLQFVPQIGWRWPDGKVVSFQNWLTAPILNSFPPSCVVVDEFGRWLTVPCADKYVYVCEMLAAPAATPTAAAQPRVPLAPIPPPVGKRSTDDDAAQVAAPIPADNPLPPTDDTPKKATILVAPLDTPIPDLTPSPAISVSTELPPTPPATPPPQPPPPATNSNPFFHNMFPPPFPFSAPFAGPFVNPFAGPFGSPFIGPFAGFFNAPFSTPFDAPSSPADPAAPRHSDPFQYDIESNRKPFHLPTMPKGFATGSGVGVSVVMDASGNVTRQDIVWDNDKVKNVPQVVEVNE